MANERPNGWSCRSFGRLTFSLAIIHVKAFTVWLEADMRACVIDAHSASNHLRQGNERANLEQEPLIPVASLQGTGTGKTYHGDR